MEKNTAALAPCPFCGAAAELIDQGTGSWRVACLQSKGGCGVSGRMTFDKGTTAVSEWNRRASHPAPQAAAEGVDDILQAAQKRVWAALDRRACPGAWMQLASDAIFGFKVDSYGNQIAATERPAIPAQGQSEPAEQTIGETFAAVGGWMNGGETGYPSFGSMDALRIYTQKAVRAVLAHRAAQEQAASGPDVALITKVHSYLLDEVRAYGEKSCADYISHYHTPEDIARHLTAPAQKA